MHETGHSIAIIFFGGKVIEFHLFPLPNVLCDVFPMSGVGIAITGLSGMVFPLLIAMVLSKKTFVLWYISQIIIGITVYAFFISIVSLIMLRFGFQMANEDVIIIVQTIPNSEFFLLPIAIILMAFSLWLFIKNNPKKRMFEYLDMKNPRIA